MERINKQLHTGFTKAADITDGEWDKIKSYMPKPDAFKQEDIRVYETQLAHNFVDRDGERFSLPVLKSFAKTIPGKAVLTGHNWGGLPGGRVFDAKLEKATIPETLAMIGNTPEKGIQRQLAKVNDQDGAIYWLITKYYMLAVDPMVQLIDAGIVKDMSIGFRAPARVDVKDAGGEKSLWREYQNTKEMEAEALEQSHVFLGSQYGAQIRKEFDGQNNEGEQEMIEVKLLDKTWQLDGEEKAAELVAEVEAKMTGLEDAAKKAGDELAAFKTAAGCETVEEIKALVVKANAAKTALVEEAVKYGALCNLIVAEKVDERKAAMMNLPDSEVELMLTQYKQIWVERNPQTGTLPEPTEEKKEENKPVVAGRVW